MTEIPEPVAMAAWLVEHAHEMKPPVNNKQMFAGSSDFIVQVVGGPNQRTDFHVDPYEEYFYQLKGDMHVNVMTADGLRRIDIREGQTWLLPGFVPHSPQRPQAGSIGLVIERIREPGTLEKFQWYCPSCAALVHEVELQVTDIVADLPPVFGAFYDNEDIRVCPSCGTRHPGKG